MVKKDAFRIKYYTRSVSGRLAFIFVGLLFIGLLIYITETVRSTLLEHNKRIMNSYARLWALAITEAVRGEELNIIFEEIIKKADFPIIQTDVDGEPIAWRNINVSPRDSAKIKRILKRMASQSTPIPVRSGEYGRTLGYIYFGESRFVSLLRYLPVGEFILLLLFLYLGFLEYERKKTRELQNIWLGMARESAHQLGTPISSLLGWVELLKNKINKPESGSQSDITCEKILAEMESDIQTLDTIVKRFGKIGSAPEIEMVNVNEVVSEAVKYFRKRIPTLYNKIEFLERYEEEHIIVPGNKLLIGWAVENLLKNSIEACDKGEGEIMVVTRTNSADNCANIIITDNGRGIPGGMQKKIFTPGFTTKKRGWGLGLSLAKRIVEEYHRGKLELLESKPYERTTFRISLPISWAE